MVTVNIHEAKTQLSRLVDQAAKGEPFVIAKAGKPIAKLTALRPRKQRRVLGQMAGQVKIGGNFDAPLPEDLQHHFGGLR